VLRRGGIIGGRAIIEPLEDTLVATVAKVVKELAVTLREVDGTENEEGRAIAYFAYSFRREVDVNNDGIPSI